MARFVDLSGQKFNRLTVVKRIENKGKYVAWLCKCDCGNEIETITASLKNGNTKSCGCLQKEKVLMLNKTKRIDETGNKYGMLTVVKSVGFNKHGNQLWLCYCDCGKKTVRAQGHLKPRNGWTVSCGCSIKESVAKTGREHGGNNFIDLTGQVFGWLEVVERIEEIKKIPTYKCVCTLCGNNKVAQGKLLLNGHVTSCGCVKSVAEKELQQYLESNNISFKTQFKFHDCRRINPLPFDFAIFDSDRLMFLIELDGIQHFYEQPNMSNLDYVQQNDSIKTNYCESNNIQLLRIPYYDFGKKEKILDEWLQKYKIGVMFNDKYKPIFTS